MFEFTKLSNIIRIRFTGKISFKMPKQERHTKKYPYNRDCTDNCQRISNDVTKWPIFKM